jgi:hypothetical protein
VLFERECEQFSYSLLGSCFGIKYKSQYLILTAKHVLDKFKDEDISIPYIFGSDYFLPINSLSTISYDPTIDDTDKFDIVIMSIDEEQLNDEFDLNSFFEIKECALEVTEFEKCVIYGFPKEINQIDYDEKKVKVQRIQLEASNISSSPYDYCFSLETKEEDKKYLNGLSGSPIVGLKTNAEGYDYCLIGMMLRQKYFLSSHWILNILKDI